MITKLKLHNWKSFKDATLYVDPLTFLIGTNASGKSNVLDAFDFLQRLFSPHYSLEDAIGSIRGGRDWIVRKGEKEFRLEVTIQDENNEEQTVAIDSIGTTNYSPHEITHKYPLLSQRYCTFSLQLFFFRCKSEA